VFQDVRLAAVGGKERNPMVTQASNVRKRLRRFLTADPKRFAGGSAVSDPLSLLAVERERLAVLRSPQHDGRPQTCWHPRTHAGTGDQPAGVRPVLGRPAADQ
jgi:hypothetical protein